MLVLLAVATLGLSGFAAWFFFGGPEDDPTRVNSPSRWPRSRPLNPKPGPAT